MEPRTGMLLKRLLRDDDGRVKGVIAHRGFRHPDLDSGTPVAIKARRAVVIASGGLS